MGVRVARLSAALALITGLLGMHGLVVIDTGHTGAPAPQSSSAATLHPPAPMTAMYGEAAASSDPPAASHHGTPDPSQHDGTPHPGAHQMLHLCLAVLAALLMLVAAVGLMWSLDRRGITAALAAIGNGRREPPLRPPPTSVRLAQLCVMRN